MATAKIVNDMHVHKPVTRMIMTWTNTEGKRESKLLAMNNDRSSALIMRTLRWASYRGIEVTFRPA